jgi:hypothetical protein
MDTYKIRLYNHCDGISHNGVPILKYFWKRGQRDLYDLVFEIRDIICVRIEGVRIEAL